jgi:hypothetical protein
MVITDVAMVGACISRGEGESSRHGSAGPVPKRVEQGVAWGKTLCRKMLGQLGRQCLGIHIHHCLQAVEQR